MAPIDTARAFARDKVAVFPVEANGKAPLVGSGFKDASFDLRQIDTWDKKFPGCNWAFEPGSIGQCVVDLDRDKTTNIHTGLEAWERLQAEHGLGGAEPTRTVRTPSGGLHLYFKGHLRPSAGRLAPNIDTRGDDSYVLLPGSLIDGKAYEVVSAVPPETLPSWVAPALAETRASATLKSTWEGEYDQPWNIEQAREYLRHRRPAVTGEHGDERTMGTAADLRKFGLSHDLILHLMGEWNKSCSPPWDDPGLETKVDAGVAHCEHEGQAGLHALTAPPEPVDAFLKDVDTSNFPGVELPIADIPEEDANADILSEAPRRKVAVYDGADLAVRTPQPLRFLWEPWVEQKTINLLIAPGGSHKSRLALQLGLSLLNGGNMLDGKTVAASVHYISGEDELDEITRRVQTMCARLDYMPDGLRVYDTREHHTPLILVDDAGFAHPSYFLTELASLVEQSAGPRLVILDSTYNVIQFAGNSKNSESAVVEALNVLDTFCATHDTAILLLFHPSRSGQRDGHTGFATAWSDRVRSSLQISADKANRYYTLSKPKHNRTAPVDPIDFTYDNGVLVKRDKTMDEAMIAMLQRRQGAAYKVAAMVAERGSYIKLHRATDGDGINGLGWALTDVEAATGVRPSLAEFLSDLAALARGGYLRYVKGTGHVVAGYRLTENRPGPAYAIDTEPSATDEPEPQLE